MFGRISQSQQKSGSSPASESQKFVDALQADFKTLALETKKKYPQIKESCEEAITRLNQATSNPQTPVFYTVNQILYPLYQGCETKDLKIIKFCLGMMQRLITQQAVDQKGARYITDALWMLMEHNIEEVKVLQTVTLLLTTNTVVHGDTLAKSLVLCFRLHYTKNPTIVNTAGATIRQLVSLVFERVNLERELNKSGVEIAAENSETPPPPKEELQMFAQDAYMLFQDLVQLVNADQPFWLIGMTEMTRTFGLELLEAVLITFSRIFFENAKFTLLLKDKVCALVIKLFSPNIKHHRQMPTAGQNSIPSTPQDKPYFPISMRLLRLVSILIQRFHVILITECEIFLSLIIKFLEPDKTSWQRALALEVIHKMVVNTDLITFFCKYYDLKNHATNILQEMIQGLGSYVRFALYNASNGGMSPGQMSVQGSSSSGLMISQSGFYFRGAFLPLISSGTSKCLFLDMLEKLEPPAIPEGYGISMVYMILIDMTSSISKSIFHENEQSVSDEKNIRSKDICQFDDENRSLYLQLINSSWTGLLTAFVPLIDAATDEIITESILKAMQNYAALCGMLDLLTPRDAFITAICRSAFPPHYALSIFNLNQTDDFRCHSRSNSGDLNNQLINPCNESDFRQQIVAVGTPLPSASLPHSVMQAPVMLTAKNLQCMRAILHLSHCNGSILGSSWHIVLATLQHLVWILGLKPSTGGSLQAIPKPALETNVGIQTAVMADLPVLSQMLSQLFETSQYLNDVALHHLIDALCKLSQEAMELAYANKEPSLFAVAKLLETGLVNLNRVDVLWRPLTNHLLEVCQHRHIRMREWGVEAVTYLVKSSLLYKHSKPLKDNMILQTMLLSPLSELSSVPHADVRQRQLECVLQILNSAGEILSYGWPTIIEIIGAMNDHHGEPLIRIAFQCLQLVITDFLPVMPFRCLPLCINTAAKFGSQSQELNISLTAIGLMWNISDYFNQNQEKLRAADIDDSMVLPEFPGTVKMPQFDKLWMCLYSKLGDLCVDLRPAVRKSAGQTLFSTITTHGHLLNPPTWQALIWRVLFPLLDNVRTLSSSASNEKVDTSGNILIHHSRNTAQKQWAETQVHTLQGVCRVFNTKRELFQQLGDFDRAWSLILEFIQNAALSRNGEVSLAALKSLQEVMFHNSDKAKKTEESNDEMWNIAWKIWLTIGMESTKISTKTGPGPIDEEGTYIPSQAYLTALVQIFPAIFKQIRKRFSTEDFEKLCSVLLNAVTIPVQTDAVPYIMSSVGDSLLTPLYDGVLQSFDLLQHEAVADKSNIHHLVPAIFNQLLMFSKFSSNPPTFQGQETTRGTSGKYMHHHHQKGSHMYSNNSSVELISMNYIPFGEKAMTMVVKLYQKTAADEMVIEKQILHKIIKTLQTPLSMKYKCASPTTWKLAIGSLTTVLNTGLKVARAKPADFKNIWEDLAETFDKFLFPLSSYAIEDRDLDEMVMDETIDCKVIELMRDEILPYSTEIPHNFLMDIVVILNKGSIHSASNETSLVCCDSSDWKLREIFAKTCFETLLRFSLLEDTCNNNSNNGAAGGISSLQQSVDGSEPVKNVTGRLAVTALLYRFQEVLQKYNEDEELSGKCPLPRYRMSEISFVLKAIATLVESLRKAPSCTVNNTAWHQLIGLYPHLVECTTTSSPEVSCSLREALLQYTYLLQPPPLPSSDPNESFNNANYNLTNGQNNN